MTAPDKIYLSDFQLKTISIRPSLDPNTKDFEYIRKDALLEWLEQEALKLDVRSDNAPVLLSKSDSCTIEEISYDTLEGIARLKITEGFEVMSSSFIDSLFNSLRKG